MSGPGNGYTVRRPVSCEYCPLSSADPSRPEAPRLCNADVENGDERGRPIFPELSNPVPGHAGKFPVWCPLRHDDLLVRLRKKAKK